MPVYRRPWFQAALAALVGLLVLSFVVPIVFGLIYATRSVLLPLTIAFMLAYIVNPPIRWAERRFGVPRWAGVLSVLAGAVLVVAVLVAVVIPPLVSQTGSLIEAARTRYPTILADWLELHPPPTGPDTEAAADLTLEGVVDAVVTRSRSPSRRRCGCMSRRSTRWSMQTPQRL